jgi:hypothetical protein
VLLDELGIPDLDRLCFRYSRQQMAIVAKPYLLRYLLHRGFSPAIFLDADILVADSLQPLLDETAAHAIALTPHLLAPLSDCARVARELNILQCGIYNGGFIGVSRREPAYRFLAWWADRMQTHCRHDISQGLHYDQRWLDLVPALFDDVHVVRDQGCNVAYWNLPERDATGAGTTHAPCRFFHFSGFEPGRGVVTRYSGRLTMEQIGPAAALFARYADLLRAEGDAECRQWPYSFGSFDNGVPIPDVARRLYQETEDAGRFGDPFLVSEPNSYFRWLNEPAEGPPGASGTVTRLWHAVYRSRPDLQGAFPDVFGGHNGAFREWILACGRTEQTIGDAFAP